MREFLFGRRCQLCDDGSVPYFYNFNDGQGRIPLHRCRDEYGEPDSTFCQNRGWFRRHPFMTSFIIFWTVYFASFTLSVVLR